MVIHMKNKITNVILLFLITCILAMTLSGCGEEAERPEAYDGEVLSNGEEGEQETDENSAEVEPPKGYLTLQEELRPAIVQIFCGDYRGSGIIWEITEEEVTVITSGHLLENGETCEVLCYAGVYYDAKVDRILEDCDIGFAVFEAGALKRDGVELTKAVPDERSGEELVQGEELIVYGSMDYVAGDFVKGYLIKAESEIQFEGYDSTQCFMLGGIIREDGQERTVTAEEDAAIAEKGLVDAGMSGSGVFDRQGKLLGILAGGDGESCFVAVPVWKITQ